MRSVTATKVKGEVIAPGSKSVAQRALALAALSQGKSEIIIRGDLSHDIQAAIKIISALGSTVSVDSERITVQGGGVSQDTLVHCGESGLSLRMFCAIAALNKCQITLTGEGSLLTRPMTMIKEPLEHLGAKVNLNGETPPVIISGPISGGKVSVDGSTSSQFLTGLLIALPLAAANSEIEVLSLKSKPYVEMTLQLVESFGGKIEATPALDQFKIRGGQKYKGQKYIVEGDWSGAAPILVSGAVAGSVTVTNLNLKSAQADAAVLNVIRSFGAKIESGENWVSVTRDELRPFSFDATDCPDLFPPLAALAAYADGKSRIRGVHRLKHKESDRASAIQSEFAKVGISSQIEDDELVIQGDKIRGGQFDSHNDHRIAMAGGILGLGSIFGVQIINPECVAKSYPDFFEDLNSIRSS